jgi:hypothetical protein
LLVSFFLLNFSLIPGHTAQAGTLRQLALTVERNEVELDFPTSLTFHLEASAPHQIEKVYLNYGTNGRGCLQGISIQTADIEPGTQVTTKWEWDFKQSGSLPPGAEIWWEWELLLDNGERLLTERQTYTLEDPRLTWKHLEDDRLTVYWVEGSSTFAQQILNITQNSLERLEAELGIQSQDTIRLTIYPDIDDLQGAFLYLSDWAGGVAISEFNTFIMAVPPDALDWAEEIIPHELTHLVVDMRMFNCLGISLPTWLSEGLAVAGEGDLSEEEIQQLVDKLEADALPGLVTLTSGFSVNGDEARLSYLHSGAIIFYLLETYGPEKLDQLLSVMQGGKNANPALLEVYGQDTAGIDQAWRASLGYGEAPLQQIVNTPLPFTPVPTLALWTAAVALTPTPTQTPLPPSTSTPTPLPPTAVPTSPPTSSSPTEAAEAGSPLRCLGGMLLGVLIPSGLVAYVEVNRRYRYP